VESTFLFLFVMLIFETGIPDALIRRRDLCQECEVTASYGVYALYLPVLRINLLYKLAEFLREHYPTQAVYRDCSAPGLLRESTARSANK
jgi:hypothetical protein